MKKPKGERGCGVHLDEIELAAASKSALRDPNYIELMVNCAVEKLRAVRSSKTIEEALEVVEREEWPKDYYK